MKMPPQLKAFLTEVEWRSLRIGSLDRDDRKDVLDILLAAFVNEDPKKVSRKDIVDVLRHVESLADDFRKRGDDEPRVGKNDAIAAEKTAREVVRELRTPRKTRLKRRKP